MHLQTHKDYDYFKAIGQVTVNFTNLESEMARSIGVLNCEEEGANIRITAGEPFANLMRLLAVLFRYRISDPDQLEKFENIIKDLNEVSDKRNINIHGICNILEAFDRTYVIKKKYSKNKLKKFDVDTTPPKLEELVSLSKEIEDVRSKLSELIWENKLTIKEHRQKSLEIETSLNSAKNKFMHNLTNQTEQPYEKPQETKAKS